MKYKNVLIIVFYSILSLLATSFVLGIDNLSFVNTQWLSAHDVTTDIISWKFFKDDIWRFPLGSNPNYGMDIGSGIAFSGSIPIMAIIFKLFASILPDNFHYFGLWILFVSSFNLILLFLSFITKLKIYCLQLLDLYFFFITTTN